LLTFEVVVRNGSFAKAADELNVTPSAISHQIKSLESFFEIKLLDRDCHSLIPTADGEALYQDIAGALALVRKGVAHLKAAASKAPVGVSIRPHFAMKWLLPRLHSTDRSNLDFDLNFHHTNSFADFNDPNINLSIEWRHQDNIPENAVLLLPANLTPACHPSLIEGIENPEDPSILEKFILLHESDDETWRSWLGFAGYAKLQPQRNEYYDDTNVRQQAAIEGLGFALVCPELIQDDIRAGRLICPFAPLLNTYSYYLIFPPDRMERPNARKFVDWLLKQKP